MKKMIVISPKNRSIYNFRGDLIKKIINKGYQVIATGPNQENLDEVLKLGVSFREVKLKKDKVDILSDIEYCKKLKQIIKEEQPDVVFSYTIKPVIYGSIAAKKSGVKEIYAMVTGLGRLFASNSFKTKVIRWVSSILYRKAFNCCNKVIFQNNDDIEQLVKLGVINKEKTVKVNGSGVNMSKFKYVDNPLNDTFLMVARIIKEKGIIEYLKAAEIVKEKYPQAKFILLGGFDNSIGSLKQEDIDYYVKNKIVEFPGETNNVFNYYKDSMCFVLPSYYREGLPRTILEAMAVGRPVITTDWTGCREAIEDGANGFLIPVKDEKTLSEKMIYMIENHDTAKKISSENNKKCKKIYDVDVVNREMLKIMNIK